MGVGGVESRDISREKYGDIHTRLLTLFLWPRKMWDEERSEWKGGKVKNKSIDI